MKYKKDEEKQQMNEIILLEEKDLRDKYIDRIEVLDKVKEIITLPDIELATTRQVADYFDVDIKLIVWHVKENREELELDGYSIWNAKKFINESNSEIKTEVKRGMFLVTFSNGKIEKFAPRGVALFTKRSILRIAMLLRDSEIAKEIRTQLLNIVEDKEVQNNIVNNISDEQQMMINIMFAKTEVDRAVAINIYDTYKNRHIEKLQKDLEIIKGEISEIDYFSAMQVIMQRLGKADKILTVELWKVFHRRLYAQHHIQLKSRAGNKSIIRRLRPDEYQIAYQCCINFALERGMTEETIEKLIGKNRNVVNK